MTRILPTAVLAGAALLAVVVGLSHPASAEDAKPSNVCAEPSMIGKVLEGMTELFSRENGHDGAIVVDAEDITTTLISENKMSCHFTALINDGSKVPGTFSVYDNAAGQAIMRFQSDAAAKQHRRRF